MISKKNDLRIVGGISIIPSAHATVSYGLSDKIAIQGFGSIGPDGSYYIQAASGLYKKLGNHKVMEFYVGYGYGYGDAPAGATLQPRATQHQSKQKWMYLASK